MNPTFQRLMREATRLTSGGKLQAATAAIQRALSRTSAQPTGPAPAAPNAGVLDGYVFEQPVAAPGWMPMPEPLSVPETAAKDAGPGAFLSGSHPHAGLTLNYKLYVPAGATGRPLPMVVMLHGCTQDPDDFAAGTGMNELAREQGFLVLYPAQSQSANPARCWNWFKHNHQGRSGGEAAVIASMTQAVMRERGVDPARVYIAGLSAGGAMAALVAAAYPELYAALGVHSGLAPGAARSLPEGLAAMRGGASTLTPTPTAAAKGGHPVQSLRRPTIVFHGDRDATVHPTNGDQVISAVLANSAQAEPGPASDPVVEQGVTMQGQHYTRTVHGKGSGTDSGAALAEHWVLHGAGHAWSGGQAAGSYTDTRGPDASREMLRFFFSHAGRAAH